MKSLLCIVQKSPGVLHLRHSDVHYHKLTQVTVKYRSHFNKTARKLRALIPVRPCSHGHDTLNDFLSNLSFDLLRHSPYSPGMTTNDLHLFRFLKHFLAVKLINSADQAKACLNHCFTLKNCFFIIPVCINITSLRKTFQNQIYLSNHSFTIVVLLFDCCCCFPMLSGST